MERHAGAGEGDDVDVVDVETVDRHEMQVGRDVDEGGDGVDGVMIG
jgi:hypothetical protein